MKTPTAAGTTRRILATIAIVTAVGAVSAGPAAASASAAGQCPEWMCGSNHNEVLVTSPED